MTLGLPPHGQRQVEVDFEFDDSTWPIVVVRWHGRPSEASLVAGLERLDTLLGRGERFGLLVDSRGSAGLSPELRRLVVSHMQKNAELNAKYLIQAFVADSLLMRTLYWAVQLLLPSPFPSKVFDDFDKARAWIVNELGDSARPRSA
jgi:hypothetical protein